MKMSTLDDAAAATELGSTPSYVIRNGWRACRLWEIARLRSEKNRPDLQLLSVFLGRGIIRYGEGGGQVHKPSLDLDGYQVVHVGDLVLNNQQAWRGSVGVSSHHGIISPAYVIMTLSPRLDMGFADYLFKSRVMVDQFVTASKGVGDIQRDIHLPWLKNVRVPLPELEEQRLIARFLKNIDSKINRYILAKRKIIAHLDEQKQAIVHRAVTLGVDQSRRLRPSGVEWLGDVPEHWVVMPLKWAFKSIEYGISDSGVDDGTIPVLTMGNIRNGEVTLPDNGGVHSVDERLQLQADDLLFNRTNSAELVGKVGLFRGADRPVTFASYLVRLRPRASMNSEFLNFVLNSPAFLSVARREAIPSLHQSNLNPTRYGRLPICLPRSEVEQEEIVKAIWRQTRSLEVAKQKADREIGLLREYRTRLVADVVTGKVDVRKRAAKLLDLADDVTILDEDKELLQDDTAAEEMHSEAEEEAA